MKCAAGCIKWEVSSGVFGIRNPLPPLSAGVGKGGRKRNNYEVTWEKGGENFTYESRSKAAKS